MVVCSATMDAEAFLEYFVGSGSNSSSSGSGSGKISKEAKKKAITMENEQKTTKKNDDSGKEGNRIINYDAKAVVGNGNAKKRKSRWGRIDDNNENDATKEQTKILMPSSSSSLNYNGKGNNNGKISTTTPSSSITTEEGTIISVDGRQHPVSIMYIQEPVSDYVKSTVEIALRIHSTEDDGDDVGDILCFLP